MVLTVHWSSWHTEPTSHQWSLFTLSVDHMGFKVTVSIKIYTSRQLISSVKVWPVLNAEKVYFKFAQFADVVTTCLALFLEVVDLLMKPTYDTLGKGGPHKSGQSQVTYLDRACGACYEDVVTLQVPMDYWRSPGVKEVKPLQDLPTPAPQDLGFHHLKAFQVTAEKDKTRCWVVKLKTFCNQPLIDSYMIPMRDKTVSSIP